MASKSSSQKPGSGALALHEASCEVVTVAAAVGNDVPNAFASMCCAWATSRSTCSSRAAPAWESRATINHGVQQVTKAAKADAMHRLARTDLAFGVRLQELGFRYQFLHLVTFLVDGPRGHRAPSRQAHLSAPIIVNSSLLNLKFVSNFFARTGFVHLEAEPPDRRKDLVGGLDPFVGLRVLVVRVDE